MADLRWDMPETEEVELSEDELAELDERIQQAESGRWYTSDEVRELMKQWASKYGSSKAR